MNYTNPNSEKDDDPKDWLSSALIFTGALSHLLQENEGVVVHLKGDMNLMFPDIDKVIVYRTDTQIRIVDCSDDLPDGQLIVMDQNI